MSEERSALVIGRTEYVDLPEWGIKRLRAKVDTGARSSALHVEAVETVSAGTISFDVVLGRRGAHTQQRVTARILREGVVRSSNGQRARRIFVATTLRLGPLERTIEISLIDRGPMIHRMLLGRTAFADGVLIDIHKRFLLRRPRKPSAPRNAP